MQNVLTGEIIDPFNGLKALNEKTIMYVDESTYVEDPLRSLRAAQFASRLDMNINERVIQLGQTLDYSHLSPERIYVELKKALMSPHPSIAIKQLKRMNVLSTILPELDALSDLSEVFARVDAAVTYRDTVSNPIAFMYVMMLLDTEALTQVQRLSNDKQLANYITLFTKHIKHIEELDMLEHYQLSRLIVELPINDAISAYQVLNNTDDVKQIKDYVGFVSNDGYGKIKKYITGKDLLNLGFKPGPQFGEKLDLLFDLQLKGYSKEQLLETIKST